jgi:hypothetical protein
MLMPLQTVINLSELDAISINGKRYWTGALYIMKQRPDYSQMVNVIRDGHKFYFIFDGHTFSGTFIWYLD